MATDTGAFRIAARDVDPMSWFTGPYVPLVFATLVTVYGGVLSALTWGVGSHPLLQVLGVALCTVTCLVIQYLASTPGRSDDVLGIVAVAGGGAGLVVSALGYAGDAFAIEQWWAPFCYALVMSCVVPYLAPWRILLYGALALVTAIPVAFVLVVDELGAWGPVGGFLLIATPVAVGAGSGTAFAYSVVDQVLPIVGNRSSAVVSELLEPDPEDEEAERATLARYTARAVPFLRKIAERGAVDAHDRMVAGEIARYLRDDLVSRSDLAWLGIRADDRRVVVIDPERRAATMRSAQRAAIRDLVRALLDDPRADSTTMLIELRADDDDSTAVGITLDSQLPEGRRVRHMAPHYFNLRGEMTDVHVRRDRLSFRVPPRDSTP